MTMLIYIGGHDNGDDGVSCHDIDDVGVGGQGDVNCWCRWSV